MFWVRDLKLKQSDACLTQKKSLPHLALLKVTSTKKKLSGFNDNYLVIYMIYIIIVKAIIIMTNIIFTLKLHGYYLHF